MERLLASIATVAFLASVAAAQVPPFIGPGASAFAPEIGVVNSGVVQDVQGVVSHDKKYVTLTMRTADTKLLALQEFQFQRLGPLGFVGDLRAVGSPLAAAVARASVLNRPGMTKLASVP